MVVPLAVTCGLLDCITRWGGLGPHPNVRDPSSIQTMGPGLPHLILTPAPAVTLTGPGLWGLRGPSPRSLSALTLGCGRALSQEKMSHWRWRGFGGGELEDGES